MKFVFDEEESKVGKGENAGYKHNVFKRLFSGSLKVGIV